MTIKSNPADPVTPRLAATVILVRDGEVGLEVLMVRRNKKLDVAAGALVFPGGALNPDDGREVSDLSIACRVAAVRETFEEAGILLARGDSGGQFIGAEQAGDILARYRPLLTQGTISFHDMIRHEELELALDLLVPTVRWITPEVRPKRYDTHFYICPAPAGQVARHDGSEAVEAIWVTPGDALEGAADGRFQILWPTQRSLAPLQTAQDVATAIDNARSKPVTTTMSTVRFFADGEIITIPADAENAAEEHFVARPSA